MKKILQAILLIAIGIVLSAFLAPVVYQFLPQFKFEKILNRLLMISVVVICFAVIRIDRSFFRQCGLIGKRSWWKQIGWGFLLCVTTLTVLTAVEWKLGVLRTSVSLGDYITGELIFSSFMTAVVVGFFEEFFFRGLIFLKLKRRFSTVQALVTTSLVYSAVHFLKSGRPYVDSTPTVWDSFRVMGSSLEAFFAWQDFWPAFIGLFLFGGVLNYAFVRSKSLFLPIGLHSGAVFYLKMATDWLAVDPSASAIIYGGKGFYSGFLGWGFIVLIGVSVHWLTRAAASPQLKAST